MHQEFTDYLKLFSSDEELTTLLLELGSGKGLETKDGRSFFKSKYGAVSGNEVEKIAQTRKWNEPLPTPASLSSSILDVRKQLEDAFQSGKFNTPTTAADFLAVSLPIPPPIAAFDRFVFGKNIITCMRIFVHYY